MRRWISACMDINIGSDEWEHVTVLRVYFTSVCIHNNNVHIASNTKYMTTYSEHLQLYIYLVWIINLQPVLQEYCWHAVNLDKQTLDIGVLRKKNYSLFLECTFDMNNCDLFLLRKKIK